MFDAVSFMVDQVITSQVGLNGKMSSYQYSDPYDKDNCFSC